MRRTGEAGFDIRPIVRVVSSMRRAGGADFDIGLHRPSRMRCSASHVDECYTGRLRAGNSATIYNRMVVRYPLSDAEIDRVFHALADATRRDIVARVLAGEQASVSALAARYAMSFAAVQKHVAVLEQAGLVTKQAQGRERIVRGIPEQLARARDLLTQLEALWKARFGRIDALFTDIPPSQE